MPSSPALSLTQAACTPVPSISPCKLAQHPIMEFVFAGTLCPVRHPGFAIDAGRYHQRHAAGFRDRFEDIDAPSDPDRAALDHGCDPDRLRLANLRDHQPDHILGFSLAIAGLVGRAQVDKDVFVRQDQTKFIACAWTKRRD